MNPGSRWMTYPTRHSPLWLLYKTPLIQYRLGLGPLLRLMRLLVLTTRGRKSGQPRHTVLEHTYHNGRVYVSPGWGDRTLWYQNILADPRVTVQRGGRTFGAIATRVTGNAQLAGIYCAARKSPVWKQYLASFGIEDTLNDYLAKKDRLVTLWLDPTPEVPLPPLRADLIWLWPMFGAGVAAWLLKRNAR
jgi:deazaflavin-dependent oxidoreductase (nitroreductase family)